MQISKGVEYALHCLVYLVDMPKGQSRGIKALAEFQGVPESYLSKIFTKLKKAGLLRSNPGVKGGYELAKRPEDISFLNVFEAVEGTQSFFQCMNIRENCILYRDQQELPKHIACGTCLIHSVMLTAEQHYKHYLTRTNLQWLHDHLQKTIPADYRHRTQIWFRSIEK